MSKKTEQAPPLTVDEVRAAFAAALAEHREIEDLTRQASAAREQLEQLQDEHRAAQYAEEDAQIERARELDERRAVLKRCQTAPTTVQEALAGVVNGAAPVGMWDSLSAADLNHMRRYHPAEFWGSLGVPWSGGE